ncbi:hypothetical protein [Hyunsoonleella ulvae]|uniref:hypothetical protein n=1 Tax=Hyunsoonleella ulvae TaxID=2799948 RepID=UPI001939C60C|nr:hypothetical protein [Hyunsoonleella ulvae]
MSRKVVEIDRQSTLPIVLFTRTTDALFNIIGTFKGWDNKKEYPSDIELNLINIPDDKYYHMSKCNFCKQKKALEIHVENVDEAVSPQNHTLHYTEAKKDNFKFKKLDLDHIYEIDILVYNNDLANSEKHYLVCGKLSNEELDHPKSIKIGGFQVHPDTSKGNIIVANP